MSTRYIALMPHSAGGFQATEVEVTGTTRDELHQAAWSKCAMGRYVSEIVELTDGGGQRTVYREHGGWLHAPLVEHPPTEREGQP